jgi:hypothetical protein
MEPCRPVVADSHHFDEEKYPHYSEVGAGSSLQAKEGSGSALKLCGSETVIENLQKANSGKNVRDVIILSAYVIKKGCFGYGTQTKNLE